MPDFRDTYTRSRRLEKLGFMMPLEARRCYEDDRLRQVAAQAKSGSRQPGASHLVESVQR